MYAIAFKSMSALRTPSMSTIFIDKGMIMILLKKKHKIVLIVAASALVVVTLGAISNTFIKDRLAANLLTEYQRQERQAANEVAQNLENNIASVQDKLNLLATMPEVIGSDATKCNDKLAEGFAVINTKVGNLGRVNADGYFYCSINKTLLGIKAEKLGAYIPQIFNDPKHTPVLSRAILPPGANTYVAALHVPVYDAQKRFQGTVGGAVYFNELQDKYLKNITFAQNGYIVLIDDNGDILYHPKSEVIGKNYTAEDVKQKLGYSVELTDAIQKAMHGESGTLQFSVKEGGRLAAYTKAQVMPGHHWTVFVVVPTIEASAELARVGVDDAFIWFTIVLAMAVAMIAVAMMVNLLRSYELQQTKDEFVSLASHQLRTPATAVKDYIELLFDEADKLSDTQKEYLTVIQESNQREIRIVNDMLNVARLDAGHIVLAPKPTKLTALVRGIVAEQLSTIQSRKQTIEVHAGQEDVSVPLDATYGRMAIENLISNASKYTNSEGMIYVAVGRRGNKAEVTVKDNGVGIAKEDMGKLFGKLNRIQNELSEQVGGTGLGLYLAKKVVELHGGKISVSSVKGQGSEFTIVLPLSKK
jgi:signal transduction histidine kinase